MNKTQRKKQVVITVDICRNIRRHIEMNRSLKEISGITEVSVLRIANKIGQGLSDNDIAKTRKGRKVHEEIEVKSRLESILNEDNSLTQKWMYQSLKMYNMNRSQGGVSNTLKKMGITRKRLTKIPVKRNSERIIGLRQSLGILGWNWFQSHNSKNYGYSQKNTKAVAMFPTNRSVNISLMAAIDINGVISYELKIVLIMG